MKLPAKKFVLTFDHKEEIAPGVVSFYFIAPADFTYRAGQYLQITLPHDDVDDDGTNRFFTIASAPDEKCIMITTRLLVGKVHKTSFKKTLISLQKGDEVNCFGPLGKFYLEEASRI